MIPNLYDILHVDRYATKEDIKKSYRRLALEWHPDKNKNIHAHEKFIEINQAYLILSDDEARSKYNIEYDLYLADIKKEPVFSDYQYDNGKKSHKTKSDYHDPDLNKWTKTANKQAEKFASMSFADFAKIIGEIVVESGKQAGTAVVYAFAGFFGSGALIALISGLINGNVTQLFISLIVLGLSILGYRLIYKRYDS